jgi:hypothetical protein
MSEDLFEGMLDPGETLLATLGASSPDLTRQGRVLSVWHAVALTRRRLLLVRLVRSRDAPDWQPDARLGVGREFVRLRTPSAPPPPGQPAPLRPSVDHVHRMEIDGCGERVLLEGLDAPGQIEPVRQFLEVWLGRLDGSAPAPTSPRPPSPVAPRPRAPAALPVGATPVRPPDMEPLLAPPAPRLQPAAPSPPSRPAPLPRQPPAPRASRTGLVVLIAFSLVGLFSCVGCVGLGALGQILQGILR